MVVRKAQFSCSWCSSWGRENNEPHWDAEITWYSPCAPRWYCLYGLEHGLRIPGFRPTWPIWSLRFSQPDRNFLNYPVTVLWSTPFSDFAQQMFLFRSTVLSPGLNSKSIGSELNYVARSSVCLLNHIRSETMYTVSVHLLVTNDSWYLSRLVLLWPCAIGCQKLVGTKIL